MSDVVRKLIEDRNYYIGKFLDMQAYLNNVDCIVLTRQDLWKFLEVDRLNGTRRRWFCQDLKEWFPYQNCYYEPGSPSSINLLFLSRTPIDPHVIEESTFYTKMPCGKIYNLHQIIRKLGWSNRL